MVRERETPFDDEQARFSAGVLGMWILLAVLAVLFVAAILGYLAVRIDNGSAFIPANAPSLPLLLLVSTAFLVLSSLTMQMALRAARTGGASQGRMMMATLGLALGFLVVQALAWRSACRGLRSDGQPLRMDLLCIDRAPWRPCRGRPAAHGDHDLARIERRLHPREPSRYRLLRHVLALSRRRLARPLRHDLARVDSLSVREVHMKRHMNWHMTVHAKCMRPKSDNAIPYGTALCADLILFFPSTAKRLEGHPNMACL